LVLGEIRGSRGVRSDQGSLSLRPMSFDLARKGGEIRFK
jgi:hypothetical protein